MNDDINIIVLYSNIFLINNNKALFQAHNIWPITVVNLQHVHRGYATVKTYNIGRRCVLVLYVLGQNPCPCAFARWQNPCPCAFTRLMGTAVGGMAITTTSAEKLRGYWSRVHSWDMNVPFMN